ncbi:TonB-dependent receptor plug domain-containing protein [Pseudobacteriovorax antillogorgiicola]|uniref:Outer membrane receptor for ferrienterochelin and colicins n=1 Tax=Pseudobacteriovorax antillogorgiicola TaxID=1513793 RepID=A0A1Y6CAE8_9BACT|nr:TonB-dependent receptor plug domain-containing protein [Pseudobacteriovorax antillogorgiicola]TCS49903.1 outer membrane receptor for ferrienterochelin and colicin [Pseudobacteriovorax antillogorgiicola]SMF44812.1 Outer membrane receptor for ferrienterochelin and colicins [Pseudobacteriovorax antillogorgiicola]
MMKKLLAFLSLILACPTYSEEDMSLSAILNLEVEVATKSKQSLRDAPSIVSVVTENDIKRAGARDLIDVLQLIPGFTFAQDVLGVVTFVSRGIYAGEGKILLLVDGIELNDISYGTHSLGHHIPVEVIERIEMIRGPGSALYGGFAELGVINIITKAKSLDGHQGTLTVGQLKSGSGTRALSYGFSKEIPKGQVYLSVRYTGSNKSEGDYTDTNGDTGPIDDSTVKGRFVNFSVEYEGLKARFLHDTHSVESEVLWGSLTADPYRKDFDTTAFSLDYTGKLIEKLSFNPYGSIKHQRSWWQPDPDQDITIGNDWRRTTERRVAGAMLRYQITDDIEWTLGGENTVDRSDIMMHFGRSGDRVVFATNSKANIELLRNSYYTQVTMNLKDIANITFGGRYEDSREFDKTFVPRLGITKVFGDAHVKLLLAKAYRLPSIENYDLNNDLKPEITTTGELEVGYIISDNLVVTGNIFDTSIQDIIVYYYDGDTDLEHYYNYDELATRGVEFELKYAFDKISGGFTLTHQEIQKNTAELFKSSLDEGNALGSPENKVTLVANYEFMKDWNVNVNGIYESSVYAFSYDQASASVLEQERDPTLVTNVFLTRDNLFVKGLDIGVGVRDLGDENPARYQAANNGAMPYPGSGQEVLVRITGTSEF